MLIPIGTVPTAYALNRALPASHIAAFTQASQAASKVVEAKASDHSVLGDPRPAVTNYISRHEMNEGTYPSLALLMREIASGIQEHGSIAKIPFAAVGNTRNDMYLASEALRFLAKDKAADLNESDKKVLKERIKSTRRRNSSRPG